MSPSEIYGRVKEEARHVFVHKAWILQRRFQRWAYIRPEKACPVEKRKDWNASLVCQPNHTCNLFSSKVRIATRIIEICEYIRP